MRIFLSYEGERVPYDINDGQIVKEVKDYVADLFCIAYPYGHPSGLDNKQLSLSYAGSDLENDWFINDLGLLPGSTLRAYMKDILKPVLYFHVTYREKTIPLLESLNLMSVSVSELRGIASRKSGLPVGVFRMVTRNDQEMFDCHTLDEYEIEEGATIHLETWDGWNEFLASCALGFTTQAMSQLVADEVVARYQMKVAMYMAAHFGHVDLAVSLLRQGIRPDEAVGEHPMRQWCKNVSHIDSLKTAIHEAVEFGQLGVLRAFVNQSVTTVMARDGNDLTPLNIALRKQQRACASFLLTKQWSRIGYTNNSSLPLSIFTKMKRWSLKAKEKVLTLHGQWRSSIKNPRRIQPPVALVGHGVQLNGFSPSKLTSKPQAVVKQEDERAREKERRRRKLYFYEEEKSGVDPENYFRQSQAAIRLPKLSRFEKLAQKPGQSGSVPKRDGDDSKTETKTSISESPELAARSGEGQEVVKFPPIKGSESVTRKQSQQNLLSGEEGTGPAAPTGKSLSPGAKPPYRAVFVQTGKNRTTPSPVKHADSSQSVLTSLETDTTGTGSPGKNIKKRNQLSKSLSDGAMLSPRRAEDIAQETLELFERYRGTKSRDYAIKCLNVANSFKELPWLHQVRIAMDISAKGVKKAVVKEPHLIMDRSPARQSLSDASRPATKVSSSNG